MGVLVAALARRLPRTVPLWQPVTAVVGPSGSGKSSVVLAGLLPHLRHYLLGTLAAREGDVRLVERCATACARLPAHAGDATMAANLTRGLRARAALLAGEADRALAELDRLELDAWIHHGRSSPVYGLAAERRLRAAVLEHLGRDSEAATWRAALGQRSPYELVFR